MASKLGNEQLAAMRGKWLRNFRGAHWTQGLPRWFFDWMVQVDDRTTLQGNPPIVSRAIDLVERSRRVPYEAWERVRKVAISSQIRILFWAMKDEHRDAREACERVIAMLGCAVGEQDTWAEIRAANDVALRRFMADPSYSSEAAWLATSAAESAAQAEALKAWSKKSWSEYSYSASQHAAQTEAVVLSACLVAIGGSRWDEAATVVLDAVEGEIGAAAAS